MTQEDTSNNSISREFGGIPLKALIGAPLKAAADANGMMARVQTDFLLSTCFQHNAETGQLSPRMVEFEVTRNTLDANSGEPLPSLSMQMRMPLLTLIPLSSLAVERLNVSFEMEVKTTHTKQEESSLQVDKSAKTSSTQHASHDSMFNAEMHGALTSSSNNKSQAMARYEIDLDVGSLPLPKGLLTVIDMFNKNMTPIPVKANPEATTENTVIEQQTPARQRQKQRRRR